MTMSLNGVILPVAYHSNWKAGGYATPYRIQKWFGVRGGKCYFGRPTDRVITIDAWITYNATSNAFNAKHSQLSQIQSNQTGPGIFNINGTVFPTVYFAGFEKGGERDGEVFYSPVVDGTGLQGWTQNLVLSFVDINTSV